MNAKTIYATALYELSKKEKDQDKLQEILREYRHFKRNDLARLRGMILAVKANIV